MANKIVISYSIDENYAALAVVSMASILKSSDKNDELVFAILYNNLSETTLSRINDIKKIKNCEIKFQKIADNEFKNFSFVYWITEASWYRCKIADLFPEYYKVLYLDCDTMVMGSLAELYNTELGNYYVAGVRDICGIKGNRGHQKRINLSNSDYINSGVTLFNCKKWREDNLFEKIKEYALTEKPLMCDQDAINKISDGNKLLLPQKFNYMEMWWDNYYHEYEGEDLKNYEEARVAPTIVHFTHIKPFSLRCKHSLKQEWWKYAKLTSFHQDLISNLYEENKNLVKDALNINKIRIKYNVLILLSLLSFGKLKNKIKKKRVKAKNKLVALSTI